MIFFQNVYGNQFTRNALEKDPKKKHVVINAEPKKSVRVLLLGTAEAGKSTILKQMKLLKLKGFNEVEINGFIATIRDNVVSAMRILLKSMATLDIPFADNERCEAVQNFIVLSNTLRNSPEDLDLEAMRLILDDFLQDQGIQACLSRRHEYHLPDSSQYFLNRVRISHCSESPFFVRKFNFNFPRKLSIFWGEKLGKMLWFWTF